MFSSLFPTLFFFPFSTEQSSLSEPFRLGQKHWHTFKESEKKKKKYWPLQQGCNHGSWSVEWEGWGLRGFIKLGITSTQTRTYATHNVRCRISFNELMWARDKHPRYFLLWNRCTVVATVKAPLLAPIAALALHPDIWKALSRSGNTSNPLNLPIFDGKSEKCSNWPRHSSAHLITAAIFKVELGQSVQTRCFVTFFPCLLSAFVSCTINLCSYAANEEEIWRTNYLENVTKMHDLDFFFMHIRHEGKIIIPVSTIYIPLHISWMLWFNQKQQLFLFI